MLAQPFDPVHEAGLTELIGADEQVDQNDYSGSVAVSLGLHVSGEILQVTLYATETGTGDKNVDVVFYDSFICHD